MRRIFRFHRGLPDPPPQPWGISAYQHRQLLELLSQIGLDIVDEAHGPVPLLTFGRRVLETLGAANGTIPLPHFADALKSVIRDMGHEHLRVMSPTDMMGVGYVYNANDPQTWPVRTSL